MRETVKSLRKEKNFLLKLLFFIFVVVMIYSAFHAHDFYNKKYHVKKAKSPNKFHNVESKIYSLDKNKKIVVKDLQDLTSEDKDEVVQDLNLSERNQNEINSLKEEIASLQEEVNKFSNPQFAKTIISYLKLRDLIFNNQPYDFYFKEFSTLTAKNEFLQEKLKSLSENLDNFKSNKEIILDFDSLIKRIVINEKTSDEKTILSGIKNFLSKFIIIRRVGVDNSGDVDNILVKIEEALAKQDYIMARNLILLLDNEQKEIAKDVINSLQSIIEVTRIDKEILDYFKNQ